MLNMRKNKGITLIALVITIIILLILAGISINAVFGENGLIKRANDTKVEQRGASVEEQVDIWKLEWETSEYVDRKPLTPEEKIKELYDQKLLTDKDISDYDFIDGDINGVFTYNGGSVTIGSKVIDFNVDNKSTDTTIASEFGKTIQVGDYVDYKPHIINGTWDWNATEPTTGKTYSELSGSLGNSTNLTTDSLKWRVLDNKGPNGAIRLISENVTSNSVYLAGADGYNNAVKLLDEICKELYSGDKGTAISMKIEDITDHMSSVWDYTSYSGYNTESSPTSRNYPLIWKDEQKQKLDGINEGTIRKK